jgi:hypothetical protein
MMMRRRRRRMMRMRMILSKACNKPTATGKMTRAERR